MFHHTRRIEPTRDACLDQPSLPPNVGSASDETVGKHGHVGGARVNYARRGPKPRFGPGPAIPLRSRDALPPVPHRACAREAAGWSVRRQRREELEILVLRHQLRVLRRKTGRPRLTPLDRVLLASASRILPRGRWASFMVSPQTLLRWHRELVRRKWTYGSKATAGRPPIDPEVRELIRATPRRIALRRGPEARRARAGWNPGTPP